MAKPKHVKRGHPQTPATKRRRLAQLRTAERQSRRKIERWRRGW